MKHTSITADNVFKLKVFDQENERRAHWIALNCHWLNQYQRSTLKIYNNTKNPNHSHHSGLNTKIVQF